MLSPTKRTILGLCQVASDPVYHAFGGQSFAFNGDCDYVLSKASPSAVASGNDYEISHTHGLCAQNSEAICVVAINVKRKNFNIQIDQENNVRIQKY